METLQEREAKITVAGICLGGLPEHFESVKRTLLITLLSEGLTPISKM
jgi:hypothetical protein